MPAWRRVTSAALVSLAVIIGNCGGACAQMTVSFAPMLTELTLAPGSSGQFTVMLRNDSADKTVECSIYAADIQQRPDGQYRLAGGWRVGVFSGALHPALGR